MPAIETEGVPGTFVHAHTTVANCELSPRDFQVLFSQIRENGIQRKVRLRLLHFGTAVVLTLCIWGHVSELFDHWDNTFKTGEDIEYSIVIVALVIGAVICFSHLAAVVIGSRAGLVCSLARLAVLAFAESTAVSCIAHSPPIPLRI
jgi:hypothetical protein